MRRANNFDLKHRVWRYWQSLGSRNQGCGKGFAVQRSIYMSLEGEKFSCFNLSKCAAWKNNPFELGQLSSCISQTITLGNNRRCYCFSIASSAETSMIPQADVNIAQLLSNQWNKPPFNLGPDSPRKICSYSWAEIYFTGNNVHSACEKKSLVLIHFLHKLREMSKKVVITSTHVSYAIMRLQRPYFLADQVNIQGIWPPGNKLPFSRKASATCKTKMGNFVQVPCL